MLNALSPIQRLEQIKRLLEHPAIDYSDVTRKFRALLNDVGYQKHPYIIRVPALVRASCHIDELWFDNVGKLGYPPKEILIRKGGFGRCNWPAEPVFYCSSETGVPIFEVRPPVGAYVVLSHWKSISSENIEIYGVSLGTEAIMSSLDENDNLLATLRQDDIFKDATSQEIKDIDRYIAKLFVEDATANQKIYWFTSSIAKVHFDNMVLQSSGKKINGLLYPSVASQLTGFNLALATDFVDANLHPKEARMYQVINCNENTLEYILKPVKKVKGCYSSGKLHWEYVSKDIADQIWYLSPQSPTIPI